jgi:predicted enzyme related to lactoylglutathione lyase
VPNLGAALQILVNVDVDDIERGIAFYRDGLGLALARRLFNGSVAEMLGASSPIYLLAKPAGTVTSRGASSARDYRRHWTPVHLDFEVADVAAAIVRATAAGALLEDGPLSLSWGRLAVLSDPFGHGLCLLEFNERGYDAVADHL